VYLIMESRASQDPSAGPAIGMLREFHALPRQRGRDMPSVNEPQTNLTNFCGNSTE